MYTFLLSRQSLDYVDYLTMDERYLGVWMVDVYFLAI